MDNNDYSPRTKKRLLFTGVSLVLGVCLATIVGFVIVSATGVAGDWRTAVGFFGTEVAVGVTAWLVSGRIYPPE